jgi:hypothetical protein
MAALEFTFVPVPTWPALAWLVECRRDSPILRVFHGSDVETTPAWFCEAAWAGTYDDGNFDATDVVTGTGVRLRGDHAVFVSPGSTCDRLQSLATADAVYVSNSLACLLNATGAEIDSSSGRYFWLFRTVVAGLSKYAREFKTSAGTVRFTYYDNLVWDGRQLTECAKPCLGRDFSSFERYETFLRESMRALGANGRAAGRRRRTYELLSTASSGYDSSTVTVLARDAGAGQVLCFDQARRGLDDSGEPLAQCLGMTAVVVPRHAWTSESLPETPFLAADAHGGDVFFKGAESVLRGKILLTGYHGDKIWDLHTTKLSPEIVRGDQSGLSLTEYRLIIGMLHCPVPFWGVRQIATVHAIGASAEMAPWDVGGDYTRPICRRIVESAGVPRALFGREKKATWVLMSRMREFLSRDSMTDYLQWIEAHRRDWLTAGRIPPVLSRRTDALEVRMRNYAATLASEQSPAWRLALMRGTGLARVAGRVGDGPTHLRRYLFGWALEHHRRRFTAPGGLGLEVTRRTQNARRPMRSSEPAATSPGRAAV